MMDYLVVAAIGILGGLASGLFGVGGGLLFVPLFILWRHWNPHLAVGTSLAIIVPTAFIAAWQHSKAGLVHWQTVLLIFLFSVLGAWLGAWLSLRMNALLLKRLFAFLLLFLAFKMFFQK